MLASMRSSGLLLVACVLLLSACDLVNGLGPDSTRSELTRRESLQRRLQQFVRREPQGALAEKASPALSSRAEDPEEECLPETDASDNAAKAPAVSTPASKKSTKTRAPKRPTKTRGSKRPKKTKASKRPAKASTSKPKSKATASKKPTTATSSKAAAATASNKKPATPAFNNPQEHKFPWCEGADSVFKPDFARYKDFATSSDILARKRGGDYSTEEACGSECSADAGCRGIEWNSSPDRAGPDAPPKTYCHFITANDRGSSTSDDDYYPLKNYDTFLRGSCEENESKVTPAMNKVCCNAVYLS